MPLIDYSLNLVRTNATKKNGREDVLLLFTKRSPICFQLDCVTISFDISKLIFVNGERGGDGGREEKSMHNHLHAIIIYKMASNVLELTRIRVERYAVSELYNINNFRNCKSTGRRQ